MAINPIPLGPSIVVPQQDFSGVGRFFDDLVKQRQEDKAAALLSSYFAGGAPPAPQKSFIGSLVDSGKRVLGLEDQPTQTASVTPSSSAAPTPGTGVVGFNHAPQSSGIGSDYAARVSNAESGGNPTAKNPRSSASGPYQFTDGTWLENFDKTFPQMAAYSPEQKLAIRDNPKYRPQQDQVFNTFTKGNEAALTKAGVPLDDVSRYGAHFFGAGDAAKVLTAPPETPLENIVSPASLEANPFLKGKTAADARAFLQSKVQAAPQAPAQVAQTGSTNAATSQMPERLRQFLPALLANPGTRALAVKMAAQYMGKPTEYGLTPVYGTDDQGNTVLGTIGKDGTFKKLDTGAGFKVSNGIDKIDVGTGFQLRNKRDGTVVGFVPKDLKGAESAKAEGKAQGAARATLPSDLQSGESAVKEIDQLLSSKGFNEVFGSVDQFRPNWTMTAEGKDALTRFNQLKGRAFLQAYSMLKGGGQITEVEGAKAENAMARLDRALSEDEAKAALTDFRDAITTGMQKMRQKAGVPDGASAPEAAATPQRKLGDIKIPMDAAKMLMSDPSPERRQQFDEIFGAGAAQRVLKR